MWSYQHNTIEEANVTNMDFIWMKKVFDEKYRPSFEIIEEKYFCNRYISACRQNIQWSSILYNHCLWLRWISIFIDLEIVILAVILKESFWCQIITLIWTDNWDFSVCNIEVCLYFEFEHLWPLIIDTHLPYSFGVSHENVGSCLTRNLTSLLCDK